MFVNFKSPFIHSYNCVTELHCATLCIRHSCYIHTYMYMYEVNNVISEPLLCIDKQFNKFFKGLPFFLPILALFDKILIENNNPKTIYCINLGFRFDNFSFVTEIMMIKVPSFKIRSTSIRSDVTKHNKNFTFFRS